MKEKDLKKVPIMDLFEQLISSGETVSIIEAIKKERGNDQVIDSRSKELENRQDILKNLPGNKIKGDKNE
ncbi:MAG: hypothetical protein H7329_12920 [Opitutaceae bacterium]|nr:hypothetical protein [Cytophagales bacterium]